MPHPENQPSQQPPRAEVVVPVIAEQLRVEKERVETGKVRVSKQVHEEYQVVEMPLVHEELNVEHVPINQYVETPPPPVRYEGTTMIMPVLREVLVVEKRLLLVEEVRISRREVTTHTAEQVTLRHEQINTEHLTKAQPGAPNGPTTSTQA
ncbi:YsnF/AvaK domain-containing protein [Hymenobacter koreensis]|uniref:YsnF/AvaK domain-containing protein n=1 Tax=Hymenobacter koreensis TaxID=1084523 RepID=UPI0031EF8289